MARFGIDNSDSESDLSSDGGSRTRSTTATPPPRSKHNSVAHNDGQGDHSGISDEDEQADDDAYSDDGMEAPPRTSLAHSADELDYDDSDDDHDMDVVPRSSTRSRRSTSGHYNDGDHDDSYDTTRLSSSSTTSSPRPPPAARQSKRHQPTRAAQNDQAWAAKLKLEPKRVQVMQASFFQQAQPTIDRGDKHDAQSRHTDIERDRKRYKVQSDASGLSTYGSLPPKVDLPAAGSPFVVRRTAPAPVPAPPLDPTPFRAYRNYERVDLAHSITSGHEGNLVDLGLTLGRSFRVTWGPNGEIVHLGKGLYGSEKTNRSDTLQIDQFRSNQSFDQEATLRDLKLQLSHTPIYPATSTSPAPVAVPHPDLRFHHFVASLSASDRSTEANLWRLGHALFDEIQDLELPANGEDQADPTQHRYIEDVRRRDLLEQWLADVVRSQVEEELRNIVDDSSSASRRSSVGAQRIFTLLSGHQIERACDAALEAGDLRLATLLAQAGGDDTFREDLYLQLSKWREYRVDAHISPAVRRVYEVLCGNVGTSEGRQAGDRADDVKELHVAQGLDWKRAFGLHLWYGTWRAPLATAVARYESAFAAESQVAQPLPEYLVSPPTTKDESRSTWRNLDSDPTSAPTDPLYQLIKLFTSPTHSLEQALLPRNFGSSPLDYRLPWHLYILFSRVLRRRDFEDRLEVDPEDEDLVHGQRDERMNGAATVEGNSVTADRVTESFASQLELNGLWEWASFVLLHLELPDSREKAIRELLCRNAARIDDDKFTFLVDTLKVPQTWIYSAQATAEHYKGDLFNEYKLLLAAERWTDAHKIAVYELAPEAIIRSDPTLLRRLFEPFEPSQVADWEEGAQIFLDYILCLEHQSRYQRHRTHQQHQPHDNGNGVEEAGDDPHRAHLARTLDAVHALATRPTTTTTTQRHTKFKIALAEMQSRLNVLAQAHNLADYSQQKTTLKRIQPSKMSEADRTVWVQGANAAFLANSINAACT